jgi:hypothetical protein
MSFLVGYKTYIAAVGLALIGIFDLLNGDTAAGVDKLVEALGLAGLRSAISSQ